MKQAPRIVVIGGGTGNFSLLVGLKDHTPHLTALVSMADDGGSTGVLRDELGALPPGDVRKCLVALARDPHIRDLFNYRFEEGSLRGHSFGNLFLTAVEKMSDNFTQAVETASAVLNITGKVLPATLDNVRLVLTRPDGSQIKGEHQLDRPLTRHLNRPKVTLEPHARITPEGRRAIIEADIVVIAPGSIYGSLAAVLVIEGMAEALTETKASVVYVCNLVAEKGQSEGFMTHDFADEIERFLGGRLLLDYVLYNTHKPSADLLARYAKEGDHWVEYDQTKLSKQHYRAIGADLMAHTPNQELLFIRHDGAKVARALLALPKNARSNTL